MKPTFKFDLALVTGIGQRLLSFPLAFSMLVAAFTAHAGFDATAGGMEYPLTLAVVALALGLLGPGHLALGSATPGREARALTAQTS